MIEPIVNHIKKVPRGKPFTLAMLRGKASYGNCRKVLSRLVKSGELNRLAQGVYVRPKMVPFIGEVLPSAQEVIETISKKTGEIITIHGAEAARILGLSTQAPLQPIYYTSGTTRKIKLNNREIILKHVSPRKLIKPGTTIGYVILAMWYFGKKDTTPAVVESIRNKLTDHEFLALLDQVQYMPGWMAVLYEPYLLNKDNYGK